MAGQRVASSAEMRGLYVVDQNGRVASAAAEGSAGLISFQEVPSPPSARMTTRAA